MKKFYSVEYVDADGELNVKHLLLTNQELQAFYQLLVESGVQDVRMQDLTPPAVEEAVAVLSGYEIKPELGSGS